MKICSKCNQTKSYEHFHKGKNYKDGYVNVCKQCKSDIRKQYYNENKLKEADNAKRYYVKNQKRLIQYSQHWRDSNPEYNKKYSQKWRKENKLHKRQQRAKERSDKFKATPKWANLDKIKEFYLNCPEGYQVDHIIPLKGRNVCGLHVENNLQYLTKIENLQKGNKYGEF